MHPSKWLFICARHPDTTQVFGGGEALTASNLKALRTCATVEVVSLMTWEGWLEKLLRLTFLPFGFTSSLYPWKVRRINKILAADGFVGAFIDQSFYGRLAKELKLQKPAMRIITCFHNHESQAALTNLPAPLYLKQQVSAIAQRNEELALQYSDTAIFLTQADLKAVQRITPQIRANLLILPAILSPQRISSSAERETTREYLFFCGSNFPPNIQGLEWFISEVLPHIPYDLHIAGFRMEKWRHKNNKLKNWGTVVDLSEHYLGAAAVIAPIFVGSGMKIKSVEALDFGKKLFATSHALAGLEEERISALETAEDFIRAICEFKKNPGPTLKSVENKFESKKAFFVDLTR